MTDEGVMIPTGGPAEETNTFQRLMELLERRRFLPEEFRRLPPTVRASVYGYLRGPLSALMIWARTRIPIPDYLLERLVGAERVLETLQSLPEEVYQHLRWMVLNVNHDPNPRVL